jgi:hypothetical protein
MLLAYVEPKVDHPFSLDDPRYCEMQIAGVHALEQTGATAKEIGTKLRRGIEHAGRRTRRCPPCPSLLTAYTGDDRFTSVKGSVPCLAHTDSAPPRR